jgi:hypothetical protein
MNNHTTALKRTAQLLIGLFLILRPHSICAQAGSVEQPINKELPQEDALKDIVSTNAQVRLVAAIQLDQRRAHLIRKLLAVLDSPIPDERKMDAALILSYCQVKEAIPFLVNHLEWQGHIITDHAAYEAYLDGLNWHRSGATSAFAVGEHNVGLDVTEVPVSTALTFMGVCAIPALLDKIIQTDDQRIIGSCVIICKDIEGPEVTQFRLQGLLQNEVDAKKKERIQSALDVLKNLNRAK